MALGNRAYGLFAYAQAHYDKGHQVVMFRAAHDGLSAALEPSAQYENPNYKNATQFFEGIRKHIASVVDVKATNRIDLDAHSLGASEDERVYRQWCLTHCLFLNPLNDVVQRPIAARDILLLPDLVAPIEEPPIFQGFFNQMKQEFISSRWLYYEAVQAKGVHFADRDVALYNTLDYPSYSIAVEKMKASYRIAYSIFDKIAFFLKTYIGLDIKPDRVSFRGIWYENNDRKRPVHAELNRSENWPLRGLYWLAKDLFDENFHDLTEPDGRALYIIRNRLEHRHLKVHELLLPSRPGAEDPDRFWRDSLAYSVQRDDFEEKTLRVLKLARAALIYLSLAVHHEERRRLSVLGETKSIPIELELLDDDRKQ